MEGLALKDPAIFPDKEVLKEVLGKSYLAFGELMKEINEPPYALVPEWRYYNDGKSWLCKVCQKKKTVFWLSAWQEEFFKVAFYFSQKTASGIYSLDIDDNTKQAFRQHKPVGKLMPLVIEVRDREQIGDILKIISFKIKN